MGPSVTHVALKLKRPNSPGELAAAVPKAQPAETLRSKTRRLLAARAAQATGGTNGADPGLQLPRGETLEKSAPKKWAQL